MEELVKKEILQVESGLISVLDESETSDWENLENETLLKYLHSGKAVTISTMADGNFEIKVIMLEGRSKTIKLMDKEKFEFIFKTNWTIARIKTGSLLVADPSTFTATPNNLKPIKIDITPGCYYVQTVLANNSTDFYGVLILLVPTEPLDIPDSYIEVANKDIKEVEALN